MLASVLMRMLFSSKDAEECVRDLDGRRFDGSRLIVEFAKDRDGGEGGCVGLCGFDWCGGQGPGEQRVRPTGQNRVIVEGLAPRTSWQDLKDQVKRLTPGEIAFCDVTDGGTKGWVEYRTAEDMQRAVTDLDGAKLREGGDPIRAHPEAAGAAMTGGAAAAAPAARRSPSPERSKRSRSRSHSRSRSGSPKRNKEEN